MNADNILAPTFGDSAGVVYTARIQTKVKQDGVNKVARKSLKDDTDRSGAIALIRAMIQAGDKEGTIVAAVVAQFKSYRADKARSLLNRVQVMDDE